MKNKKQEVKSFLKNILYLVSLFFLIGTIGYSQVSVRGYTRKDGTYVRPHERTYPNSTVTDNYSYPGNYNPNLEYNPPLRSSSSSYSRSSSSYPSSSSSYTSSSYPSSSSSYTSSSYPSSSSSYPSSSSSYTKTYPSSSSTSTISLNVSSISNSVKVFLSNVDIPSRVRHVTSSYVNVRSRPVLDDYNIIGILEYNSNVILVEDQGTWSKVIVRDDSEDELRYAYIASNLLSRNKATESNQYNYNSDCEYYYVISDKTYFHSSPDFSTQRKGYLIRGEKVCKKSERYGFIYVEFVNARNQTSKGWIVKSDLNSY